MGWRIVRQPNGLLARFSSIVDHFTHVNLTETEAFEVCRDEGCSVDLAKDKVSAGVQDFKPWTRTPGTGLERWEDCLDTIRMVHGEEEAQGVVRSLSQVLL